jgi:hypothetical protein
MHKNTVCAFYFSFFFFHGSITGCWLQNEADMLQLGR